METESLKTCTKCLYPKDLEQFPIHKNYKGGRTTWCRVCLSVQSKRWHLENKGRSYEFSRKSYRKNPDVKRNSKFKWRYGITLNEFNEMSKTQNDKCAICSKPKEENLKGRLFIDHSHKTGKIRKLLCNNCNSGIGQFKEDVNLLQYAINYLELHK